MPKLRFTPPQVLLGSFLAVILWGSILLSTPWATQGKPVDMLTALFTATSALSVTGLIVVDTGTHWSLFGQLVILLLIQVGGLGIMSFTTFLALLLGKKVQLRQRLILQQAINKNSVEGIVNVFRYLLIFSLAVESIGALVLAMHWAPALGLTKALWYGVFHSVSAFNNAGFDLFGNYHSLTSYTTDITVNLMITSLIIIGGLGFVVIYELINYYRQRVLSLHVKLVLATTLALIIVGTFIIFITEYNHALRVFNPANKLLVAYFQAVSPRTAGFNTIDLNNLFVSSQLLIIMLMFIGGSPGSTAGGIKTTTFALLSAVTINVLKGKKDTTILKRSINQQQVNRALSIAWLGLLLVCIFTFLLSLTHQSNLVQVMFEVVSALGTVGLTLGLTTELNNWGRILIIMAMILGRLGPLTIGYALVYRQKQPDINYPEGKIMVG